ncbi:MAG: acetate kinase [Desulfamplus sp.]|nr:acetate kinase [Desulfamplus sp.]
MVVLIINAGSSSLKYQLLNMQIPSGLVKLKDISNQDYKVMASGVVERIGEEARGRLTHKKHNIKDGQEIKFVKEQEIKDHAIAMRLAVSMLTDNESGSGVIKNTNEIDAIGHRVVQGGEMFKSSTLINEAVKEAICHNYPLAPLHNPPNLTGIEVAESLFPSTPNVAVFDTEFHQSIPQKAFMYALPYEFYEKFRVRRYGFHGTSHKFVSNAATKLINQNRVAKEQKTDQNKGQKKGLNLITLHLGNGCSICAIKDGKCIDTSMGMTPLAGVMMGTRVGDIDPAIQNYLIEYANLSNQEISTIFNKQSGLKGICGMNDMRDIHAKAKSGDERAQVGLQMFAYQVKKYIGAYFAALGYVDAIVFTAGIGENDSVIREMICSDLTGLGIEIDLIKNIASLNLQDKEIKDATGARAIHSDKSAVEIWIVPTNEELQIAMEVVEVLNNRS